MHMNFVQKKKINLGKKSIKRIFYHREKLVNDFY